MKYYIYIAFNNEIPTNNSEELALLPTTTTEVTLPITTTEELLPTATTETLLPTTTTESTVTTSDAAKRPAATSKLVNMYDPIQQYPMAIPHLNTSSGQKYALPLHSPKSSRESKQSDKSTAVNKVLMYITVYG